MGPHTKYANRALLLEDFIDQAMLYVDSPRVGALKITDKLFVRWRILKWVICQHLDQRLSFAL